jgi:hypothetical protein
MPTPKRVTHWHTLSVAQGNAVQIGGLLGATALAWHAGRRGAHGTRWMVASRLLAYVRCRHRRDRDRERRDPGLRLAARRARGPEFFRRGEPVECAVASQRVAAPRRGPASCVAGARGVKVARQAAQASPCRRYSGLDLRLNPRLGASSSRAC